MKTETNLDLTQVQAVFSDIDGTLLNDDRQVSPRTLAAIHRLTIPFVPVTGRHVKMLNPLYQDTGLSSLKVTCNGAVILDKDDNVLFRKICDRAAIRQVMDLYYQLPHDEIAMDIFNESTWYCNAKMASLGELIWNMMHALPDEVINTREETIDDDVVKVLFFGTKKKLAPLYEAVLPYQDRLTIFHDNPEMLEIFPKGVDKGEGVLRACQILGVDPRFALGAGDTSMDKALMLACGYRVGLANAYDELKEVSNILTDGNNDDGLAKVLERI